MEKGIAIRDNNTNNLDLPANEETLTFLPLK